MNEPFFFSFFIKVTIENKILLKEKVKKSAVTDVEVSKRLVLMQW